MIANLTPYPAMKASGVERLGDLPLHWKLVPLKRIGWFRSGAGFPISAQGNVQGGIPFAKVSDMNRRGNDRELASVANVVTRDVADELGAHVFPPGTIIFPKVGGALLTNKRRILVRRTCIDNNLMGCVVTGADTEFTFQILRWLDLGRIAKPGPVPAISEGEIKELRVQLPPASEQVAIVRFLDHADRRIRRYIRAKERLIKLLEEQKQAIIHQAVTGQIDVRTGQPYSAYKDSGVGWLGRLPTHWQVLRLKCGAQCSSGVQIATENVSSTPSSDEGRQVPVIGGNGNMGFAGVANVGFPTIAIGRVGALCGNVHVVKPPAWITDNALILQVDPRVLELQYVAELLRHRNLNELANQSAQPLITGTQVRMQRIPFPPLWEQRAIATWVNETTSQVVKCVAAIQNSVNLLQEYRTRLVADVVTGKLDVREAAAAMPKEPDAPTYAMETINHENAAERQEEMAL